MGHKGQEVAGANNDNFSLVEQSEHKEQNSSVAETILG